MKEIKTIFHTGPITSVSWSPNGSFVVATDANRKVLWFFYIFYLLYLGTDFKLCISQQY